MEVLQKYCDRYMNVRTGGVLLYDRLSRSYLLYPICPGKTLLPKIIVPSLPRVRLLCFVGFVWLTWVRPSDPRRQTVELDDHLTRQRLDPYSPYPDLQERRKELPSPVEGLQTFSVTKFKIVSFSKCFSRNLLSLSPPPPSLLPSLCVSPDPLSESPPLSGPPSWTFSSGLTRCRS